MSNKIIRKIKIADKNLTTSNRGIKKTVFTMIPESSLNSFLNKKGISGVKEAEVFHRYSTLKKSGVVDTQTGKIKTKNMHPDMEQLQDIYEKEKEKRRLAIKWFESRYKINTSKRPVSVSTFGVNVRNLLDEETYSKYNRDKIDPVYFVNTGNPTRHSPDVVLKTTFFDIFPVYDGAQNYFYRVKKIDQYRTLPSIINDLGSGYTEALMFHAGKKFAESPEVDRLLKVAALPKMDGETKRNEQIDIAKRRLFGYGRVGRNRVGKKYVTDIKENGYDLLDQHNHPFLERARRVGDYYEKRFNTNRLVYQKLPENIKKEISRREKKSRAKENQYFHSVIHQPEAKYKNYLYTDNTPNDALKVKLDVRRDRLVKLISHPNTPNNEREAAKKRLEVLDKNSFFKL